MRTFSFGALVDGGDLGGFRNAFDEKNRGKDHPDFDSDSEVREDRQAKGGHENCSIALGPFAQADKLVPFAHVVSDDDEHGAESGERNEPGQRSGSENDYEKGQRVN